MLFVSGQIPIDSGTGTVVDGDIVVQTERVLKNLEAVLKAADMSFSNVLQCSCFLVDMNDFARFNEVYGQYLGESAPARETVQVGKLPKGVRVEISAICEMTAGTRTGPRRANKSPQGRAAFTCAVRARREDDLADLDRRAQHVARAAADLLPRKPPEQDARDERARRPEPAGAHGGDNERECRQDGRRRARRGTRGDDAGLASHVGKDPHGRRARCCGRTSTRPAGRGGGCRGKRKERGGAEQQGEPDRRAAHGPDPRVLEDAKHCLPVPPAVERIRAVGKAVQVDGAREERRRARQEQRPRPRAGRASAAPAAAAASSRPMASPAAG